MIPLIIAAPAARDLADIIAYISLDNHVAAERVGRAIIGTARRLTSFPNLGRQGRLAGTREVAVPGSPYLVVYEYRQGSVTILAVFHGARDLARAFAERKAEISKQ